ncbi:hypothetical protein [Roseateles sp.]|uniref:hypothetical protein n=1 Tax=Roseateles sp. TaxID=1971397 RepID=UPI002F405D25
MSVKPTTVYVIACDGRGCIYEFQDLEFGHTVSWMTESEAIDQDVSYQEWTRVAGLHFCDQPGCQEEAAAEKQALAARQQIPPLPGQLDLLAEVSA